MVKKIMIKNKHDRVLKDLVYQKSENAVIHHLLTLSFQTCMTFYYIILPWNTKSDYFFKNILATLSNLMRTGKVKLQNDKKHHERTIKVVHITCALYSKSSEAIIYIQKTWKTAQKLYG